MDFARFLFGTVVSFLIPAAKPNVPVSPSIEGAPRDDENVDQIGLLTIVGSEEVAQAETEPLDDTTPLINAEVERAAQREAEPPEQIAGSSQTDISANLKDDETSRAEIEARKHVASIRKAKGVDGLSSPSEDLIAALQIISEQLYQKPTRFLLELLQNADDNSYKTSSIPTLNIIYNSGMLRIDCNEVGFSHENLKALCSLGQSTKKVTNQGTRYIGQKGIGFKSVFKVADAVWVSSGAYSIKFDKATPLGMLVPIWCEFPQNRLPGATSILLKLSGRCNISKLIQELSSINSTILLFLRQLREINIEIKVGGLLGDNVLGLKCDRITKLRRDPATDAGGVRQVTIYQDDKPSKYLIASHQVCHLPEDPRRDGCTQSAVLLGFPIGKRVQFNETAEPHLVYAFLPIRDYGFKFMIQADFLLVVNREDIDSSSWNHALLEGIPPALLSAIKEFNQTNMRYSWLKFLPDRFDQGSIFETLSTQIYERLSEEKILESLDGELDKPCHLTIVPSEYSDDNGMPLVPSGISGSKFLSQKYPPWFNKELERLGTKVMSEQDFLEELGNFVSKNAVKFQNMSNEWHSTVAKTLAALCIRRPAYEDTIKKLPIVPLSDGSWSSAESGPIFFPPESLSWAIPNGTGAMVVHCTVLDAPSRLNLLKLLGITQVNERAIAECILRTHKNLNLKSHCLSTPDIVSHAIFLDQTGWSQNEDTFWFMSKDGSLQAGPNIYIDVEKDCPFWESSATKLLPEHNFLHSDYLKHFRDSRSRKWLVRTFHVSDIPRLVTPVLRFGDPYTLHSDFRFLIDKKQSTTILCLLRDNWRSYSDWIVSTHYTGESTTAGLNEASTSVYAKHKESQKKLAIELSSMKVECYGVNSASLCETNLPRNGVQMTAKGEKLLVVVDPDDTRWDFLEIFGVTIKSNNEKLELTTGKTPERFLLELMELKELKLNKAHLTRNYASALYEKLEMCVVMKEQSTMKVEFIRHGFDEHALIFLPNLVANGQGKWVDPQFCVWDGPDCLKQFVKLKDCYPERYRFFTQVLGCTNANLETLANESSEITFRDDLGYIKEMLRTISYYLDREMAKRGQKRIPNFTEFNIFPIRSAHTYSGFSQLCNASGSEEWYITDRRSLKRSFEGLLDLLAMNDEEIESIQPLIEHLQLKRRLLSEYVKEKHLAESEVLMANFTEALRAKVRYICLLMPQQNLDRKSILEKLCRLQVYRASRIIVQRTVMFRGSTVNGIAEMIRMGFSMRGRRLIIHILEEDFASENYAIELTEKFVDICGIKRHEYFLVSHILMGRDVQSIEETLKRRGIEFDFTDFPEFSLPSHNDDKNFEHSFSNNRNYEVAPDRRAGPGKYQQIGFFRSSDNAFETALHHRSTDAEELRDASRPILPPGIFQSMNGGAFFSEAITANFVDGDPKEIQFYGELYVSNVLRRFMDEDYDPSTHWTSPLRVRAGHKPYECTESYESMFTIQDRNRKLTNILSQKGYKQLSKLKRPATFHIEVHVTTGDLHSSFQLDTNKIAKVEKFTMVGQSKIRNILVLARVYHLYKGPEMCFFVDPWKLHLDGSLTLTSHTTIGRIEKTAVPIFAQGSTDTIFHSEVEDLYSYDQLAPRQIRLFELFPGTKDTALEGKIHHVSIDAPRAFWALSYVWGPVPTPLAPFCIKTEEGAIAITASLDLALRQFRESEGSQWLWVDAVCINQANTFEKSLQIPLIADIYQSAENVVAWLGDKSDNSDLAVKALKNICATGLDPLANKVPQNNADFVPNRSQPTDEDWEHINNLLSRSWFGRVWIVQELVLGSRVTIVCGDSEISWEDFYKALQICENQRNISRLCKQDEILLFSNAGPAYALGHTRSRLKKEGRKFDLLDLLERFSYTKATQTCDKIFALLGLSSDASSPTDEKSHFYANYDSTFEDVVRQYAKGFVDQGRVMDLLYRSGATRSYPFCSWIPAWTAETFPQTISTWGSGTKGFRAGPVGPPTTKIHSGVPFKLEIWGWSVDRIKSKNRIRMGTGDLIPFADAMKDISASIADLVDYPTGESAEDLMLKIPIGNARYPHRESTLSAMLSYREFLQESNISTDWAPDLKDVIFSVHLDGDTRKYHAKSAREHLLFYKFWETATAFAKRFPRPTFGTTQRGYAGIIPEAAERGDEICIFPGGKVPFLLRKSGLHHKMIGECYIHGMMYGESERFDNVLEKSFCLV